MDNSSINVDSSNERSCPRDSSNFISVLDDLWDNVRTKFNFIVKPIDSLHQNIRPQFTFIARQYCRFKVFLDNFIHLNPNFSFLLGWVLLVFSLKMEVNGYHYGLLPVILAVSGVYLIYKPINYWTNDDDQRDDRTDQTEVTNAQSWAYQDPFIPNRYNFVLTDRPPRYESLPNLHPEMFKRSEEIEESEMPPRYSVIFSTNNPEVCSIHQYRGSASNAGVELATSRSLGDLPSSSRPLDHT